MGLEIIYMSVLWICWVFVTGICTKAIKDDLREIINLLKGGKDVE